MGEDVEGGICGENNNWWSSIDSTRSASVFIPPLITSSSSPNCSVVAATNDAGNCTTWQTTGDDFMDLKSRSCGGFPDEQKPHKNDNNNNESADGESGSILMDSTLQIMGYGLSSSTSLPNWDHHHSLLRAENNLNNNPMVVEEERGIDCSKEWITSKSFSASSSSPLFSNRSMMSSSIRRGFPIGSSSYVSPSTLIHSLYADPDPQSQSQSQSQAHHSLFTNLSTMSYSSSPSFLKPSPMAKQQQTPVGLHFSNNTPFWNASADALNDIRAGAFASSSPSPSSILFNKLIKSEESDTESAKKNVGEAAFKRPRIETPSPLPTFKVRKEKLGDRVTALQQLVSPFGKTDTASVLHEAIEYIKFLHNQVSVLSTPYMKSGGPIHDQRQQGCDDRKESLSSSKEDLRSRGLCLVPISSTFPVATETTADFWTPSLSFAAAGASLLR